MTKRLSRTVVSETTARDAAFEARLIGSSDAPYSGDCTSPVIIPATGLPSPILTFGKDTQVRNVDLAVRCRKCDACRRARRRHWAARAVAEIQAAPRTWFGTLTLAPEHQFRLAALARQSSAKRGNRWADLSADDQFKELQRQLVPELQKYFKRLRKAGARFRYLVAVERHKSGAPHVHLLVHEIAEPVRWRTLSDKWDKGFSKFNLIAEEENHRAANYVAKYLTKALSRMLASAAYGALQDQEMPPQAPNKF